MIRDVLLVRLKLCVYVFYYVSDELAGGRLPHAPRPGTFGRQLLRRPLPQLVVFESLANNRGGSLSNRSLIIVAARFRSRGWRFLRLCLCTFYYVSLRCVRRIANRASLLSQPWRFLSRFIYSDSFERVVSCLGLTRVKQLVIPNCVELPLVRQAGLL